MDELDRRLLTALQRGLPLDRHPFRVLGYDLGLGEEEVIARLRSLKEQKVLRRVGGIISTKDIGFTSALVAARVPPERLEEVAAVVSEYPGVTHNYQRPGELNLWFTLIARPEENLETLVDEIARRTGAELHLMPTLQTFKIGVQLDLTGGADDA